MRYTMLATACLLTLTACDYRFSAKDAAEADTKHLCQIYNGQLGKNRDNPDIKAELERRGKSRCIDPVVAEHKRTGQVMGALFGPLGAGIHALASPEPTEGTPENNPTVDNEIAQVRREQADRQRRERIAAMVAQGASDEDIRKALSSLPPN